MKSRAWIILILVGIIVSFSEIAFVHKDAPGRLLPDMSALRAIQPDHLGHNPIISEIACHCKPPLSGAAARRAHFSTALFLLQLFPFRRIIA
jgi:hypothetical protein